MLCRLPCQRPVRLYLMETDAKKAARGVNRIKKGRIGVPAIKQIYKIYKITATSDQTVTRGGVSLFFNKRRISEMRL